MIFFVGFFTFFTSFVSAYELSVCAIFQNEAPYFKEWIDYHRSVGVEHFWLYNNESQDQFLEVLQPYIEEGIVELYDWKNLWPKERFGYSCQPAAYRDAIAKAKGETAWLAIIDLDEYMVPMIGKDLRDILATHYASAAAIYVSWLPFGTDGLFLGPGPILPHLTACAKRKHKSCGIGKSLVRPEAVVSINEPHLCTLFPPFRYLDGDGELKRDPYHHDKLIRINHYMFRDEWYFWNTKVPRYYQWGGSVEELSKLNRDFSKTHDFKILELLN